MSAVATLRPPYMQPVLIVAVVAALVLVSERGRDLLVVGAATSIGLAWLAVGLVVAHGKIDSWTLDV